MRTPTKRTQMTARVDIATPGDTMQPAKTECLYGYAPYGHPHMIVRLSR
jgi:hypothetical protein